MAQDIETGETRPVTGDANCQEWQEYRAQIDCVLNTVRQIYAEMEQEEFWPLDVILDRVLFGICKAGDPDNPAFNEWLRAQVYAWAFAEHDAGKLAMRISCDVARVRPADFFRWAAESRHFMGHPLGFQLLLELLAKELPQQDAEPGVEALQVNHKPMKCPSCGCEESRVRYTYRCGAEIRRRRVCVKCGFRYWTVERVE